MSSPVCERCGVSVATTALFRTAPQGGPAHWQCGACIDTPPCADLLAVTDAVQLGVDPRRMSGVEVVSYRAESEDGPDE